MTTDFTDLTELPGSPATRDQRARLYHRYHLAGTYAAGKRVLEVACGAGLGLGYMAQNAKYVVGGDYTENLTRIAQAHYRQRVPLARLDAHYLPFANRSFDLIVLYEAIYYLARAEQFIAESRRLLSSGGVLLICTVNKDWPEFAPSPHSTRYYSAPELQALFAQQGFAAWEFYGTCPTTVATTKQHVISLIRKAAISLDLMPKTLGARAWLKGIFYGRLTPLPAEIVDGMTELYPLAPISAHVANADYKVLYAIGHAP